MRDLNAFRVPGYQYHLTRAQDINNDSAITGSAVALPITPASQTEAFLAIPSGVPAGSTGRTASVRRPRGIMAVVQDSAHPMAPRAKREQR
jgi:hypothetical protein